ncbi:KTSC domain-containing protein [Brevibacillus fortis]|uniref:KTSC domain-containing protein n=1 Tax=Brevibacillus fortis TaxID=2126352 RepID=A0A2P7UN45_9BACL|nr:KTSC domain-containing protein [Brevibacillus fortis]MED1781577.1 KTSC domain-containing protein [Brevibacillus fortis]PSJ88233.1 KTSC domain-containing protein [Brevibacillus fortis]
MRSYFRQFLPRQNQPPEIPYKELDSKLIRAARYDLTASHLYIRFHDGREVVYCRVTPYAYNAFLNADSFSDHFHSFISQRYLNYQVM